MKTMTTAICHRITWLFLLCFASFGASGIDRGVSGLWYNRSQTGHGFELTVVSPSSATVTWYTYNASGDPVWVAGVLSETSPGVLSGNVSYYDGMVFGQFNPSTNREFPWGTLRFTFSGCDNATVDYNGTLRYADGSGFGAGSIPLVKLASVLGQTCGGSTSVPASFAGVYEGALRVNATGAVIPATAVLEANGMATLSAPGHAAYFGTYSANGSAVVFNFTGQTVAGVTFTNGATTATVTGSGSGRVMDYLSGAYSASNDAGTFTLSYLGITTRPVSLAAMAGVYRDATSRTTLVWTLSSNGSITGRDGLGCTFSGTLTQVTSGIGAFNANMSATGCGNQDGAYVGKAIVRDFGAYGNSRGLVLAMQGPRNSISVELRHD